MKKCKYPLCSRPVKGKGLCSGHYNASAVYELAQIRRMQRKQVEIDELQSVYVIGSLECDLLKIGRTKNLLSRIDSMQTGMPYELRVFGALFAHPDDCIVLEWHTHKVLTEMGFHYRGEWFDISPDDAEAVLNKVAGNQNISAMQPHQYFPGMRDRHHIMTHLELKNIERMEDIFRYRGKMHSPLALSEGTE